MMGNVPMGGMGMPGHFGMVPPSGPMGQAPPGMVPTSASGMVPMAGPSGMVPVGAGAMGAGMVPMGGQMVNDMGERGP